MKDSVTVSRASSALAPDLSRFSCGAEAYDAPARRRDVLEAIRIIEAERPRMDWREILPTYGTAGHLRIDTYNVPIWLLHWVASISGCAVAVAIAVLVWKWVLAR